MTTGIDDGTRSPPAAKDSESDTGALAAELTERLAQADTLQAEADALNARIAALEVDVIEADLRTDPLPEGVSPDDAAAIAGLAARLAEVRRALGALGKAPDVARDDRARLARMHQAREALAFWLDPPPDTSSKPAATGARIVLLVATALAVWGAWAWHPIVLALLVPVAAPIGLLLSRGDNRVWQRLGGRQRFERTGVEPPDEWQPDEVRERLTRLDGEIESLSARVAANPPEPDGDDGADAGAAAGDVRDADSAFAELSLELVEVEQSLAARARRAAVDLESMDTATRQRFDLAAADARARGELRRQRAERARLASEASDIRDAVWRALNNRAGGSLGVSTEPAALREAIDALAGRARRAQPGTD